MTVWNTLVAKWSQLARRERILVAAGALVVAGLIVDGALLDPARRGQSSVSSSLAAKQKELAAHVKQRQQLSAEIDSAKVDPALTLGMAELVSKSLSSEQLWDATAAERWFDAGVEDFGADLTFLAVSNAGEPDVSLRSLFAHDWALHARGDWRKIHMFLRATGARGALRVDSVELLSDPQGQLRLKVKGKALSAAQAWSPSKELKSERGQK